MRAILMLVILGGLAFAQIDPQGGAGPDPSGPDEIPVYLPGGEQAGPTLPSQRGIGPIFVNNRLLRIRPYIGINAVYDTGLAPIVTDTSGNLLTPNAYGGVLTFGAIGSRAYRRSLLNLAYAGTVIHYPQIPFLTGSNHRLNLDFSHSLSRKWTFNSANGAGALNNAFMGNFGMPLTQNAGIDNLSEEAFNNVMWFLNTHQAMTYQRSARMSFTAGGGGFTRFRRSSALASMVGGEAQGSIAYRTSARTTIGGSYNYTQFSFSNSYGGTNLHGVAFNFGHQLSRRTEISLAIGGSRIESQSLQAVALDPVLASLLGRPQGVQAVYRLNYLPTVDARFTHRRDSWSFNASGSRAVNPGNGLILTNMRTNASAGIAYTGLQRWTFTSSGGYSQMQGLLGPLGRFRMYNAGIGMTCRLGGGLSWTGGVQARRFIADEASLTNPLFLRTQYRFQTGLRWNPSEIPVPFF